MMFDVEQLAQEAGMVTQFHMAHKGIAPICFTDTEMGVSFAQLERFMHLVIEKEREACATLAGGTSPAIGEAIRKRKD
jgi:S-adenosylmethionine synthetase